MNIKINMRSRVSIDLIRCELHEIRIIGIVMIAICCIQIVYGVMENVLRHVLFVHFDAFLSGFVVGKSTYDENILAIVDFYIRHYNI